VTDVNEAEPPATRMMARGERTGDDGRDEQAVPQEASWRPGTLATLLTSLPNSGRRQSRKRRRVPVGAQGCRRGATSG
jgi:hypothetical protein